MSELPLVAILRGLPPAEARRAEDRMVNEGDPNSR